MIKRVIKKLAGLFTSKEEQTTRSNQPRVHKSAEDREKRKEESAHNKPKRKRRRKKRTTTEGSTSPQTHSQHTHTNTSEHDQKSNKQSKANSKGQQHRKAHKPREIVLPELVEVEAEEGKTRFSDLNLSKEIQCATQDLGFKYCTPIQAISLPHALSGKDVTGKAQTGTGKTAAFLIAAMDHMIKNPIAKRYPGTCRALVLAPTRELAIQIHKDAEALGKFTNLNNLVIFGGMGHQKQRNELSKPIDVLVATPGRALDYIRSRHLNLQDTEILVIDEADRMLDMGFIPDVRQIVNRTPRPGQRHTLFFSATLTSTILRLVNSWLHDPVTVETEPEEMVTDLIEQRFFSVMSKDKLASLLWFIKNDDVERMIIFVNRKDTGSRVARQLSHQGIDVDVLSGDVQQSKRIKVLERLRSGKVKILVATDVAARGIHIKGITHVVNWDLPVQAEDYVHRIGRTGRAGQKGKAVSFVCESGAYVTMDLEKYLDKKLVYEYPEPEMLKLPEKEKITSMN